MLRRLSSILAAAAVALTALAVAAPAAHAGTEESQFVSLANSARANRGLRSYTVASDLVSVARRHAQRMAAKHTIFHNPNLGGEVSNWQAVGENVGMGGSVSSIHNAFMNSAAHRANILDTDFTQVGMGTAYDDKGVLYVTQVFRKPAGSTAPTTTPKPIVSRPRPAPAPVVTTRTPGRTVSRPVAKPVARKAVPAKKADPRAALAARLRRARALAARSERSGAVADAVTYLRVMRTLA